MEADRSSGGTAAGGRVGVTLLLHNATLSLPVVVDENGKERERERERESEARDDHPTTAAQEEGGRDREHLFHISSSVCSTPLKHTTYKLLLLTNHNNLSVIS